MIYNCIAFVAIALIPSRPLFELRAYLKTFAVVVNAISATTNVAIAVVFSLYFQKFKNGFPSIMLFNSDSIEVNYVMARYLQMLLAINTGCITTLCSISSLVSILAAPDTLIYVAFFFSIGRLHAITLLTTLNAREMIRQSDNDAGTKPGRTSPLVFRPQATGKSSIRDGVKVAVQILEQLEAYDSMSTETMSKRVPYKDETSIEHGSEWIGSHNG
ncbi:hypothetical protein F5877DRAFT_85240 [Lentinula edodes]|nr:hypothetical protein F5877DRAFT_85240 [Lentinula edodes]